MSHRVTINIVALCDHLSESPSHADESESHRTVLSRTSLANAYEIDPMRSGLVVVLKGDCWESPSLVSSKDVDF